LWGRPLGCRPTPTPRRCRCLRGSYHRCHSRMPWYCTLFGVFADSYPGSPGPSEKSSLRMARSRSLYRRLLLATVEVRDGTTTVPWLAGKRPPGKPPPFDLSEPKQLGGVNPDFPQEPRRLMKNFSRCDAERCLRRRYPNGRALG
jgi:hypothetical protein